MKLELDLDPDDAARLSRLKFLKPMKSGKTRGQPLRIVWHDSPERTLARQALTVAEQRSQWRLEQLRPSERSWAPGAPPPVLASAPSLPELGQQLPDPLLPMAGLEGRSSRINLATEDGPVAMTLLTGIIRSVTAEHRTGRVWLEGPSAAVRTLADSLAGECRIAVPHSSLAEAALALASGLPPPPRRTGAPQLPKGLSVPAALAHVVGHLTDVILHFAPMAAEARTGPEPVHQMRVAVRRLRSAIKVFRPAVETPALIAADNSLKALAGVLAPTRDWDVFMTETAVRVSASFPDEPRLKRLLANAERIRSGCHEQLRQYLDGADFRRLGLSLACLAQDYATAPDSTEPDAPAPEPAEPEAVSGAPQSLQDFAAHVLDKRLKRLVQIDGDLATLEPAALHAIRLRAKRLRYAAEIFIPLFSSKHTHRFVRRLSKLQDRLGALNDGAVAANLLGVLNTTGNAFAIGLVQGFVGAHGSDLREEIEAAWRRFVRLDPFWR